MPYGAKRARVIRRAVNCYVGDEIAPGKNSLKLTGFGARLKYVTLTEGVTDAYPANLRKILTQPGVLIENEFL